MCPNPQTNDSFPQKKRETENQKDFRYAKDLCLAERDSRTEFQGLDMNIKDSQSSNSQKPYFSSWVFSSLG